MSTSTELADRIWPIADLLRHDYKRSDYGKIILPMTILRRFDCVLADTKDDVLAAAEEALKLGEKAAEIRLNRIAKQAFHNRSPYDFARLKSDHRHDQLATNLMHYINGFSANVRQIFEYFSFADNIARLDQAQLLFRIISEFSAIDLRLATADNLKMGEAFENLLRRFSEQSNETAGEHFTPREVIELIVNLLLTEDNELLSKEGVVRTLFDPACGTGGMLTAAEDHLRKLNEGGRLELFGQEINPESFAIGKSDVLIKGRNAANIHFGNSFTVDGTHGQTFDYMLSNPPFGVEWKKVETHIRNEYEKLGHAGRFGAGLPRISDGSLLFLQHMLSKRKEDGNGTRIGVVFNGSPLFSGSAGSGESEIRRWIIENDWLETVVALPDQLFYNTGIYTYIWIVTNKKSARRKGKVQLINGVNHYVKMKKSLGNKRHKLGTGKDNEPAHIAELTQLHGNFTPGPLVKIFDNEDFGYRRITVERPLRMRFALMVPGLRQALRITAPIEARRRIWQALTHGVARTSETLDENALLDTYFDTRSGETARQRALEELFNNLASPLSALPPVLNQRDFATQLQRLYVSASIKPPAPKQFLALMIALGERDEDAEIVKDENGVKALADAELRDFENVPLKKDVYEFFAEEVTPHVPDAWINEEVRDECDHQVGKVGYEIPFTRHFYEYKPLEDLATIEAEILSLEAQIAGMLQETLG